MFKGAPLTDQTCRAFRRGITTIERLEWERVVMGTWLGYFSESYSYCYRRRDLAAGTARRALTAADRLTD